MPQITFPCPGCCNRPACPCDCVDCPRCSNNTLIFLYLASGFADPDLNRAISLFWYAARNGTCNYTYQLTNWLIDLRLVGALWYLTISPVGSPNVYVRYVLEDSQWSCFAAGNVMRFDSQKGNPLSAYPPTVLVTGVGTCRCTNGTSFPACGICTKCLANRQVYVVSVKGLTGGLCPNANNDYFYLPDISQSLRTCEWTPTGVAASQTSLSYDRLADKWRLSFSAVGSFGATYELSGAAWNCNADNVMPKVFDAGVCANVPDTLTVAPISKANCVNDTLGLADPPPDLFVTITKTSGLLCIPCYEGSFRMPWNLLTRSWQYAPPNDPCYKLIEFSAVRNVTDYQTCQKQCWTALTILDTSNRLIDIVIVGGPCSVPRLHQFSIPGFFVCNYNALVTT